MPSPIVDLESHATASPSDTDGILTWDHTCSPGATLLLITIGTGSSDANQRTVDSVSYNGRPCTVVVADDGGTFEHSEIWKLDNPPTGSAFTVNVSCGATGGTQITAGAISFFKASVRSYGSNSGNTANPSATVADTMDGDIVVSVIASDEGPDATLTANGTLIWEDEDVANDSDFGAQRQVATGANTVCSWTATSLGSEWAICGVAVKYVSYDPARTSDFWKQPMLRGPF